MLKYLTEHKQVYGVDISRKMLKLARRRLPANNVKLICITDCTIPIEDESVDLVYSFLTLQHIDRADVVKLVGEFHRILKAGGYCYLQFPFYGDGERVYGISSFDATVILPFFSSVIHVSSES